MDPDRLNSAGRLGGDARIVGVGRLKGWGIRFDLYSENNQSGVTDIVPSSREHVKGILYQVPYELVFSPRTGRSRMDEIEGRRTRQEEQLQATENLSLEKSKKG